MDLWRMKPMAFIRTRKLNVLEMDISALDFQGYELIVRNTAHS